VRRSASIANPPLDAILARDYHPARSRFVRRRTLTMNTTRQS